MINNCRIPYGGRFMAGITGVMVALILMLAGLVPPFSRMLVSLPMAWALALFILIPSITVYYDVKERFWAEVSKSTVKLK